MGAFGSPGGVQIAARRRAFAVGSFQIRKQVRVTGLSSD
jgi:hypothetical protein